MLKCPEFHLIMEGKCVVTKMCIVRRLKRFVEQPFPVPPIAAHHFCRVKSLVHILESEDYVIHLLLKSVKMSFVGKTYIYKCSVESVIFIVLM